MDLAIKTCENPAQFDLFLLVQFEEIYGLHILLCAPDVADGID